MPNRNQLSNAVRPSGSGLVRRGDMLSPSELAPTNKMKVVLCRAGLDPKAFSVPTGTTLKILLDEADTKHDKHIVTIGSAKVTGDQILKNNDVVFVVPKPKNA